MTRWRLLVALVLVAVAAWLVVSPATPARAGTITVGPAIDTDSSTHIAFTCPGLSGSWQPPGCNSHTGEEDTAEVLRVRTFASWTSQSVIGHASCGTAAGVILSSWTGSSTSIGAGANSNVSLGSLNCASSGSWALRIWVTAVTGGATLLEWQSIFYSSTGNCPTAAPAGSLCVWVVNTPTASVSISIPPGGWSPSPCPSTVSTPYACVYAVNQVTPTVSPADITPITAGISEARGSLVVGFALVLFVGGWLVLMLWRRSR